MGDLNDWRRRRQHLNPKVIIFQKSNYSLRLKLAIDIIAVIEGAFSSRAVL